MEREQKEKIERQKKVNIEDKDKIIEGLSKKQNKDKIEKIIMIIIIIILLLMLFLLGNKIGKIGYKEVSNNPENNITIIKVTDKDTELTKDTELDIFVNEKFNGEKKIAPRSKGTYKFYVENVTDGNITYNMKFSDEMKHLINMKYRLKIDNVYIRGDENKYINIDELNVEDIIVLKDSINIFTLEWYWADDDSKDTLVGSQKTDEYYTLNLEIDSDNYNE